MVKHAKTPYRAQKKELVWGEGQFRGRWRGALGRVRRQPRQKQQAAQGPVSFSFCFDHARCYGTFTVVLYAQPALASKSFLFFVTRIVAMDTALPKVALFAVGVGKEEALLVTDSLDEGFQGCELPYLLGIGTLQ